MTHVKQRKPSMEISNMNLCRITLISILLAMPLVVSAQSTAIPGFDQRLANQEQRIQQGLQSGSLTPREAARLEKGQERLRKMEEKAKADGRVTGRERARLTRAENLQSARIYRQTHDGRHDRNHDGKVDRPLRNRR